MPPLDPPPRYTTSPSGLTLNPKQKRGFVGVGGVVLCQRVSVTC